MTAWQNLVARSLHQIETFIFPTNMSESSFQTWRWLLELFSTEPTICSVFLVTGFTDVIWFFTTFNTKVLLTAFSITSYSIFCHVLRGLMGYRLTFFIFLAFHNFTRDHFHDVVAGALHECIVNFDYLHVLVILNCF